MCGHAVIALGRYTIDYKLVKPVSPETQIKIQCPCELVTAHVEQVILGLRASQLLPLR